MKYPVCRAPAESRGGLSLQLAFQAVFPAPVDSQPGGLSLAPKIIIREIRDIFFAIAYSNRCKADPSLQMEGRWEMGENPRELEKYPLSKQGDLWKKGGHVTHAGLPGAREEETGRSLVLSGHWVYPNQ